jgi:hypothetical protein
LALTFLPPWHFIIEANRLQAPIYAIALCVLALTFPWMRRVVSKGAQCVVGALLIAFLLRFLHLNQPFFLTGSREVDGSTPPPAQFSVVSLGVRSAADLPAARVLLEGGSPDIVGLWGYGAGEVGRALATATPAFAGVLLGEKVALLSRAPLIGEGRTSLGEDASPGLMATVAAPGGAAALVAVFDLPPLTDSPTMIRNRRAIRRVATEARHAAVPVVVLGDLQGRLGGSLYSILTEGSDLVDAAWGRGWWLPGDRYPFHRLFALDHVLVKGARVTAMTAVPRSGSGAAPLRVELALPPLGALD